MLYCPARIWMKLCFLYLDWRMQPHPGKKKNLQQGLFRCQSFISLFVWPPRAELLGFKSTMFVWEHVSHLSSAKINNCQGSGCTIRSEASSGLTLTDIISAKVCLCITSPFLICLSLQSNENHILSSHLWGTNTNAKCQCFYVLHNKNK